MTKKEAIKLIDKQNRRIKKLEKQIKELIPPEIKHGISREEELFDLVYEGVCGDTDNSGAFGPP